MDSAVNRLRSWVLENEDRLAASGISIKIVFPNPYPNEGLKAAIQLENAQWGVQYSVWDTPVFQSSVDIIEKLSLKAWARDTQPRDVRSIDHTLELVLEGMLTGDFGLLGPADSFYYEEPPIV